MKKRERIIMAAVLRKEAGRSWPLLLLKCIVKKRSLFKATRWAKENTEESRYVSRLAPLAALYKILSERVGRGEALRIAARMFVPIGVCEQWDNLHSLNIEGERGVKRLMAFYNFMGEGGSGQFVNRVLVEDSGEGIKYKVRDCPFTRFFKEVGMLELATCICKIDNAFFPSAIPDYDFSRDGSWENTSAYGKDHCIFCFIRKKNPPDERYMQKTPLLDYTHPHIQMLFEELNLPYRCDREKISHLYEYVRRGVRADRCAKSVAKRRTASMVLRSRRGDDVSKTILFMALLRAAGIPCRAHFAATGEGVKSRVDVYSGNRWISVARWTDDCNGVGYQPVGWEIEETENSLGGPPFEYLGVFDSPDDFLKFQTQKSRNIHHK